MCYTKLPVEIWHQILFSAFDARYVLDTTIDTTEGCYWHQQDLYHDEKAYVVSERQRKLLREVCHSWRLFVDEYKYRWVAYSSNADPMSVRQKEAVAATNYALEPISRKVSIHLKRFHFPVVSNDDLMLLRNVLCRISQTVTTLWLECPNDYRDGVFAALINCKDTLPSLRCLMLTQPSDNATPLLSLSEAFPKLTGLTMSGTEVIPHSPRDMIILPKLQSLYLDVPSIKGLRPEGWQVPEIVRFVTPTDDVGHIYDIGINLVRLYGSQLVFLDLIGWSTGKLPTGFWTWCPVLTELEACFSRIDLGGPLPITHPLKYIIHSPDPSFIDTEANQSSLLWRNIQILPRKLESIIVASCGGWAGYLKRLEFQYERSSIDRYFEKIESLCEERSVRVEDETKTTLQAFLGSL